MTTSFEEACRKADAELKAKANGDDADKKKKRQIEILIRHAERESTIFHTSDGRTWADLMIHGHRETWEISSRGFRRLLLVSYRKLVGYIPKPDVIKEVIDALDAKAAVEGEERTVFMRVAGQDGILYLDLCDRDWRCIEISAGCGWKVIDNPPIRFRRTPAMLPLPVPEPGGNIEALRKLLTLGKDEFVLTVGWLLAALRPRGPYPVANIFGEHGAAKTTTAKVLRQLIDPNAMPVRRPQRGEQDLFIAAANSHIIAFDNISLLQPWMSDALCTLATDGAFSTRRLYSNSEEQLFRAQRPIVVNGIVNAIERPDLADRSLYLPLDAVPDDQRRTEEEFWAGFEREHPRILGALLTAVAHGLKMLPHIQPATLPRMADFTRWAMACEGALWPAGTFERAYARNRLGGIEDTPAADPVATAVRQFMSNHSQWFGQLKALLAQLSDIAGEAVTKTKDWPRSERGLSNRLKIVAPFLRRVGIEVTSGERTEHGRTITITTANARKEAPAESSGSSAEARNGNNNNKNNGISPDGCSASTVSQPSGSRAHRQPSDGISPSNLRTNSQSSGYNRLNLQQKCRTVAADGAAGTCDHCSRPADSEPLCLVADGDGRQAWLHRRCELSWLHGVFARTGVGGRP
jgi:hypothetical protein